MTEAEAKHQEKRPAQKQRPGRRRPGLRFQLTLAFCALSVALLHFRGSHSVLVSAVHMQVALFFQHLSCPCTDLLAPRSQCRWGRGSSRGRDSHGSLTSWSWA